MVGERKITRNRISYSCQTCRRRKVKCDKTHPICGGCQRSGEECLWGDNDPNVESAQHGAPVIRETTLKKRKEPTEADNFLEPPAQITSELQALEQKMAQVTSMIQEFNPSTPPTSQKASPSADFAPRDRLQDLAQTAQSNSDGPWSIILSQLTELNRVLRNANAKLERQTVSSDQEKVLNKTQQPKFSTRFDGTTLEHYVKTSKEGELIAPADDETNAYLRSWLASVYPIYPIVPPRLVIEKWREFRKWYNYDLDRGIPNPVLEYMPLLHAATIGGMSAMSLKGTQKWIPWISRQEIFPVLRVKFERSLEDSGYSIDPSVPLVAAAVINTSTTHRQSCIKNSVEVATALRAAQLTGIHRDRSLSQLPIQEAEIRRRLWWELVYLDISISTATALPPLVNAEFTDTSTPSDLKDSVMGTPAAVEYENNLKTAGNMPDMADDPANFDTGSMVSVVRLVAQARYQIAAATQKLLKINMGAKQMTKEDMAESRKILNDTWKIVRSIIDRIPARGIPELEFGPQNISTVTIDHTTAMGDPITEEEIEFYEERRHTSSRLGQARFYLAQHHRAARLAFHKWARIMLSMMLDRLRCISYAPFLKNAKSKLWAVARNCALKDCHSYMRKFLTLATDPELERFRWTWPSMFQPMHAAIILLVDAYERPHSQEAPISRAFIDKMFSLAAPDQGIVSGDFGVAAAIPLREGGEEVFKMLLKLRHQGWQKAKLDPEVLWTEEDQIKVGAGLPLNENELFMRSLREDILHQHRQRAARKDDPHQPDDLPIITKQAFGSMFVAAKGQLLHPTQAGIPGDTMTGPIHESILLNTEDEKSFHLLVRARDDQQTMPYTMSGKLRNDSVYEGPTVISTEPKPVAEPEVDSGIFHVGELIRKIKDMQAEQKMRGTQQAASSENANEASLPQGAIENIGQSQSNHYFGDIPVVECTTVGDVPTHPTEFMSGITSDPSDPSVPQTHLGFALPDSTGVNANHLPFPQPLSKTLDTSGTGLAQNGVHYEPDLNVQPTYAEVEADLSTNVDYKFDWQRWDEIFGQECPGFEDLLIQNDTSMDWDLFS